MQFSKAYLVLLLSLGIICVGTTNARADQTSEAILKLLIKKGIITQKEINQIKAEVAKEERKVPQTISERVTKLEEKQSVLPSWVKDTKLKGDFRVRYQWTENSDAVDQHRGRYRFRIGLESQVNEALKIAAGLATGSSDPRSTNQTMTGNFDTPDIRLDYAYAKYSPYDWLTLEAGKLEAVKKLMFAPSDLLWDADIHPDGGMVQLNTSLEEYDLDLFLNTGVWVLDESSSDVSDPIMTVIQPGLKKKFGNLSLTTALTGYVFSGVKGSLMKNSSGTNTVDSNGVLSSNYNSLSPSLELAMKHPFEEICPFLDEHVPYGAFFGEYINNLNADAENDGYLVGVKFGDKKVKKLHDWQFKYMYRWLEQDAWLDIFPDSDVLGGITDVSSHELIFNYAVAKNSFVGLDYYYNTRAEGSDRNDILQIDWSTKF